MSKNKDEKFVDRSTSTTKEIPTIYCQAAKSRTSIISKKSPPTTVSLEYHQRPEFSFRSKSQDVRKQQKTSSHREITTKKEENIEKEQISQAEISIQEDKVLSEREFVVNDCWRTESDEIQVKLVEIIKGADNNEPGLPIKKRKYDLEEDEIKSPPYTKEFHLLTEVQKAKIFTAVEDAIKKLSSEDQYPVCREEDDKQGLGIIAQTSIERFLCKKFLLPWVLMKVVEMVLCHIIQLTFLSEDSYSEKKQEYLPIVVTYYLTLFIIVVSLVGHISCFTYSGIQNPCYFMGIISSSILTLTTTLGMFIILSSMEYYKSFLQILVLIFIGVLLCLLFAELCLCYIQVKSIWNAVGQSDQYYIT